MARRPGTKKEQDIQLLQALRFVEVAQHDEGVPYQTHCRLAGNQVIAFDGILAAGHPLDIEANGAPNTKKLIAALSKVRGAFTMTMLDTLHLSITAGAFRALVPCLAPLDLADTYADPPNYSIGPEFLEAAEKASTFVTDGAQTAVYASVITQAWSVIGTNGVGLVEAQHGHNMPDGLMIPHSFISAAIKCGLKPVRFGFSDASFTLHFETGAWLRTQLYLDALPGGLSQVVASMAERTTTPIPEQLSVAIDAVLPFTDERKTIHVRDGKIASHDIDAIGAQYTIDGVPGNVVFNGALFKKMSPLFNAVDFFTHNDRIVFYGDKVRGLLMKVASVSR